MGLGRPTFFSGNHRHPNKRGEGEATSFGRLTILSLSYTLVSLLPAVIEQRSFISLSFSPLSLSLLVAALYLSPSDSVEIRDEFELDSIGSKKKEKVRSIVLHHKETHDQSFSLSLLFGSQKLGATPSDFRPEKVNPPLHV
jgi:hypothetical protein